MLGTLGTLMLNNPAITGSLLGMAAGQLIGGNTKSTLLGGAIGGVGGAGYGATQGTGLLADILGTGATDTAASSVMSSTADKAVPSAFGGTVGNYGNIAPSAVAEGLMPTAGLGEAAASAIPKAVDPFTIAGATLPEWGTGASAVSDIYFKNRASGQADEALAQRNRESDALYKSMNREVEKEENMTGNMSAGFSNYYYA